MAWTPFPQTAYGQADDVTEQQRDVELLGAWSEACARVGQGHPWSEIAADVERSLEKAGTTPHADQIARYLKSIRLAEEQVESTAIAGPNDSPESLVAALMYSQILSAPDTSPDVGLILQPLHLHRKADNSLEIHWVSLGLQPEHEFIDPAIRVFKRGREMIPVLLDALEDRTATRSVFMMTGSHRPSVLCLRSDLALALLEAITRCTFYRSGGTEWFAQSHEAVRSGVIDLARRWWKETQSLPDLEARGWLIGQIPYDYASTMIEAMIVEGHTDFAIKHLHANLYEDTGQVRPTVAHRLGALGDRSFLNEILMRNSQGETPSRHEIDMLVAYGSQREYELLARLVREDCSKSSESENKISRMILFVIGETDNRNAVAVAAEALGVDDPFTDYSKVNRPSRATMQGDSRAEMAARVIQNLTGRDFRYSQDAPPESRQKAIERIREWWKAEGQGLYGFESSRIRRTGTIR